MSRRTPIIDVEAIAERHATVGEATRTKGENKEQQLLSDMGMPVISSF
jgi:hypothetical protein